MNKTDSIITSNWFVLGEGASGIYSDITIEVRKSEKATLIRGPHIQLKDKQTLRAIEKELRDSWIDKYDKDGVCLEITILDVGLDPTGRKYKVFNSINGVMYDALPKIGLEPPQIFGL